MRQMVLGLMLVLVHKKLEIMILLLENDIINTIAADKIGAIGLFILLLVAMIFIFCYKTYNNMKRKK